MATSSTFGCYLAITEFVLFDELPSQQFDTTVAHVAVGLFSYEDKNYSSQLTCKMYSRSELANSDSALKLAQAFGVIANITIGVCLILLFFLSCCSVQRSVLKSICVLLCLGGFFNALTLLIFASDVLCESCELFFGSGIALLCTLVTFINAMVTYQVPLVEVEEEKTVATNRRNVPPSDVFTDEEDSDETHEANGFSEASRKDDNEIALPQPAPTVIRTKRIGKIVKTIVNHDGSQSVEKAVLYR